MSGFCSGLLYNYSLNLQVRNRLYKMVDEGKNIFGTGGVGMIIH